MTFDSILSRIKTVSVIVMCGAIALAALQLRQMLIQIGAPLAEIGSVVHKAGTAVDGINTSIAGLNLIDQKDTADPKRTALEEIKDNLAGMSRFGYEFTKDQRDYWKKFPDQANGMISNVNGLIANVGGYLRTTSADIHGVLVALADDLKTIAPVTQATTETLAQLKKAIADLDGLIKDPAIKEALPQILAILTNTSGITGAVKGISLDAQDKFHHYLYDPPTKRAKLIGALELAYKILLLKSAL